MVLKNFGIPMTMAFSFKKYSKWKYNHQAMQAVDCAAERDKRLCEKPKLYPLLLGTSGSVVNVKIAV